MKEYKRAYPFFSLCGLNCGLCPRYQTKGESKCPGCGGERFFQKHPTCAVITCNNKHDNVEYCFQCGSFPCEKYSRPGSADSFISYQNVLADFDKAQKGGLEKYKIELNEKMAILEDLINNYNDGRRKNYYCVAVNLLQLDDLREILSEIHEKISREDSTMKDKIIKIVSLFEEKARNANIELKLRK